MVKRWLRSWFGGSPSPAAERRASGESETTVESGAGPREAAKGFPRSAVPASLEGVLEDLRQHICSGSQDPLSVEEVDSRAHMYDAGYVNSITGADLLVHIENRYGLYIPETDLVGNLSSLDALAKHIVSAKS